MAEQIAILRRDLSHLTNQLEPDSFLNLLAFGRLVTPNGQYWVQGQALHAVVTDRHLIAGYDQDLAKPRGLLALGGVDYEAYIEDGDERRRDPRVWAPFVLIETR